MSEAPKKIFISVHPDYGPWECYTQSDENLSDLYPEHQYIRADIVDELVEALEWIDNRCPKQILEQEPHKAHWEAAHDAGACARFALKKARGEG